jgi:hypothetical protein
VLEDVPMPGVHYHHGVRSRAKSFSDRGCLVLFTPVEMIIGKIITVDFEAEADGRPHKIAESRIVRVIARFGGRIATGFQRRARFVWFLPLGTRPPARVDSCGIAWPVVCERLTALFVIAAANTIMTTALAGREDMRFHSVRREPKPTWSRR